MNNLPPKGQAMKDYKDGLGFDENPYLKDSSDYIIYQKEMHRLFGEELKGLNQELGAYDARNTETA